MKNKIVVGMMLLLFLGAVQISGYAALGRDLYEGDESSCPITPVMITVLDCSSGTCVFVGFDNGYIDCLGNLVDIE